MEAAALQGILPEFSDTRQAELELLEVGEEEILAMWKCLGLTMDIRPDRNFAIRVTQPER